MAKMQTKGAVLTYDAGGGGAAAVAQIVSFSHSGAETETYDATTIDTSGSGREYLASGFTEGGTFDFTLFFDSELAGHKLLTADVTTPAERDYSIQLSGGTAMAFTAAGISFGFQGDMADGVKADVSLKLDQLMTYTT